MPVIIWFIAAEVLSICENLALGGVVRRGGIPVP
jgi:hypothetical protein